MKKTLRTTSGLAAGGVWLVGHFTGIFESSAPVPAFAKPRPTAKPPGVKRKRKTAYRQIRDYPRKMK